jgi:glycosyltransferase involved in cell wall biosynthesis
MKASLSTSVVIAVYNGAKYLEEQLDSVRLQTRPADEVLISDDCSSDHSRSLVLSYLDRFRLHSTWRLICNSANVGYNKNYIEGARLAAGDILFFCDQDDIWDRRKIELVARQYEQNEGLRALASTFSVIDEHGKSSNTLYTAARVGRGGIKRIAFAEQLRRNFSVGCALTVRRSFYLDLLPIIIRHGLPYDVPVGMFAASTDGYHVIQAPLVSRRVHAGNVSAPMYTLSARLRHPLRHIEGRDARIRLWRAFVESPGHSAAARFVPEVAEALGGLELARDSLANRKLAPLLRLLAFNHRMIGRLLIFVDILVILFGSYGPRQSPGGAPPGTSRH